MLSSLWATVKANILAPSYLDMRTGLALVSPIGRSASLSRHISALILARVQLLCTIFAILVPLCAVVDFALFPLATAAKLMWLRLASAVTFAIIAMPRWTKRVTPGIALTALAATLLTPAAFNLVSSNLLSNVTEYSAAGQLLAQLYTYLPTVALAGLAIFPLTAIETAFLAAPVVAMSLVTMLASSDFSLIANGGVLWFMTMTLGVSIFSGMSQCHYMAALVRTATHDGLTGALNRKAGEEALKAEFKQAQATKKPLSLLFFDIDKFKQVNDTYGHEAGDVVIQTFADRIRKTIRGSDTLARWGGEEFVLICPDTSPTQAEQLLARLRTTGLGLRPSGEVLTASIGVSVSTEDAVATHEDLVARADSRMYTAKQTGRNGIVYPDEGRQTLMV